MEVAERAKGRKGFQGTRFHWILIHPPPKSPLQDSGPIIAASLCYLPYSLSSSLRLKTHFPKTFGVITKKNKDFWVKYEITLKFWGTSKLSSNNIFLIYLFLCVN